MVSQRRIALVLLAAVSVLLVASRLGVEARGYANLQRRFEAQEEEARRLDQVAAEAEHPLRSLSLGAGQKLAAATLGDRVMTSWFTQSLDHFNSQDVGRTFQQRYYSNFEAFEAGGPVFLYIGGEAELTNNSIANGYALTLAKENKGALFGLEHRYYGRSHAFTDLASENMVFLTVEQALEDAAVFIRAMSAQHANIADAPWVTIGGSYPGALSAYMRQKYPHLVVGSLASSAPVMAKAAFWEYDAVVSAGAGQTCSDQLRAANVLIEAQLDASPAAAVEIKRQFGCEKLDASDDVGFLYVLADAVSYAIQYTSSSPRSSGYHLKEELCDRWMLNTTSGVTPVERFAGFFGVLMGRLGDTCYDFTTILPVLNDTRTEPNLNSRQWYWQSCLQFGFFQSAPNASLPGEPQPVRSPRIDLQYHLDLCKAVFGWAMVPDIDGTNARYGGTDIVSSHIFASSGSVDPWKVLSLTSNRTCCPSVQARVIQGTAHCADLGTPDAVHDLPDLTDTRLRISQAVKEWIASARLADCPTYLTNCNGTCVDTSSNVNYCGGCAPSTAVDPSLPSYCQNGELMSVYGGDSSSMPGRELFIAGCVTLVVGLLFLGLGLHALRRVSTLKQLQKLEQHEAREKQLETASFSQSTMSQARTPLRSQEY